MNKDERIISPQNERLKSWVKLQKDGAARREQGEFVLEGRRLVETALDSGLVTTFLYSDKMAKGDPLIDRAHDMGLECLMLSLVAFRKLAQVPSPQGVACVARLPASDVSKLFSGDALLMIACGVQEPGNLGTMVRSSAAAGATGLVALSPSADLFHPRSVRGSAGAVLTLPTARMTDHEFMAYVEKTDLRILSAVPRDGVEYTSADYTRPLAIAVGSEAHGVPESVASNATGVTIPMPGGIESLNAATAAALLAFEAIRNT
jgi:TrmH family RNA methyltransferase